MVQLAHLAFGLIGSQLALAKPSPSAESVRGSLTILSDNDLENAPLPGSGAILVSHAQNYASAVKTCDQLSETLWNGPSASTLNTSLAYQVYQGHYDNGAKFWVAKDDDSCKCRALSADGIYHETKCTENLPVLCSQSAPVSNGSFADTSASFQITQEVGKAQVTGYRDIYAWKFLGLRYAPTPERYEPSTTLRGVSGPISGLNFGADCVQRDYPDSSEDCLFINIWTPSLPTKKPSKDELKPVLFYIFGGNFETGSSKNPYLDLTNVASRGDVVAVSINHRIGNFAQIAFNDGVHNGNLALNDQISALKWVAENIEAFGGDPDRVTLMGESSGAVSVRLILASPEGEGLYAGAISQSDATGGLLKTYGTLLSPEMSYAVSTKPVLAEVGCDGVEDELACLRNVPAQTLANLDPAKAATVTNPVVDGKYMVTPILPLDGSGPRYAKDIPLLTGVTRDEVGLFRILDTIPWDFVTFYPWIDLMRTYQGYFQVDAEAIIANLDVIGITEQSTPRELLTATISILSKSMYNCLDMAKAYSGVKNDVFEKVYSFNFHRTYSPPPNDTPFCRAPITPEFPYGDPSGDYFRCHGGSQVTLFGNYERVGLPDRDGHDQDFSRLVVDYFTSFVRTGDPNPEHDFLVARGYESTISQISKVGEWKEVDPPAPEWRILERDTGMAPFSDSELCNLLGEPLNYWE
ncbi:camp-regulated D2 protein, partial [Plectosphaerella plurivora]